MSTLQNAWQASVTPSPSVTVTSERHWYAVQTRARHEKKVTVQLENEGIDTFLPSVTQTHRWSDRHKKVQVPLFTCYTFLRAVDCRSVRGLVLQTPGVVDLVGVRGQPLPIPDKEIQDLQTLLAHNLTCVLYPFLRVGQRVRIRGGCLEGVEGILVALNGDRRLIVSIELIRRSMAVSIEDYDVEPV